MSIVSSSHFLFFYSKQDFSSFTPFDKNALKYIIHTKVGEGPSRLE